MGRGSGGRSGGGGGGAPARNRQIGGAGYGGPGARVNTLGRRVTRGGGGGGGAAGQGSARKGGGGSASAFERTIRNSRSTESQVKAAWKQAMRDNHPDRGGNQEVAKRINSQYQAWKSKRRR